MAFLFFKKTNLSDWLNSITCKKEHSSIQNCKDNILSFGVLDIADYFGLNMVFPSSLCKYLPKD